MVQDRNYSAGTFQSLFSGCKRPGLKL